MKCPCCGECNMDEGYMKELQDVRTKRSRICKSYLKKGVTSIESEVIADNTPNNRFRFLQAISKVEDDIVIYVVARFTLHRLQMQGYGYNYLRSMILKKGV